MERVNLKDSRIKKLETEIKNGNPKAVDIFWENVKVQRTPLIEKIDGDNENRLVTLVYKEKSKLKNVVLIPPVGMRKLEDCIMKKVEDSNVWYISFKVRKDIRFSYQFSPNDPLNNDWNRRWKNVEGDEFNDNNLNFTGKVTDKYKLVPYVIMEDAKKHLWTRDNFTADKGKIEEYEIYSNILSEKRKISVYIPNVFPENDDGYGVLVLNDGFEYLNILKAKNVLDNLISKNEIQPIIAVFLHSTESRAENLKCSDNFSKFIVEEVVDFIGSIYNISKRPEKNIIGGYSLGGLAASYIALMYPNVFANVLSQSGSYWYKRDGYDDKNEIWINYVYRRSVKFPIKFYINVGIIEPKKSMIDTNVSFNKMLNKLGYEVKFEMFGSGHDYLCWGETLAHGLRYLIPQK